MALFSYKRIGSRTLDEFTTLIRNRESLVLLGPQLVGKRYVISRICERLAEIKFPKPIVVACRPTHDAEPLSDSHFMDANAEDNRGPPTPERIFETVDSNLNGPTRSATLMLSNVDALPYGDARALLTGVRMRVEAAETGKTLSVVITGELDLRELVYGPNSEFNCTNQYVVQGLDRDLFREFVEAYAGSLNLRFSNEGEPIDYIYHETGGNIYLFRLILWAVIERSMFQKRKLPDELDRKLLADAVASKQIPWSLGPGTVRHAISRISRDPDTWPRLSELLKNGETQAKPVPDLLELTGVAIRHDDRLTISSPIVEGILKAYYTSERFVTLYCRDRNWTQAQIQFATTAVVERRSHERQEEVAEIEPIIRGTSVELYSEIPNGAAAVRKLFSKACLYILGYSHVTFWKRQVSPTPNSSSDWIYDLDANGDGTKEPLGFKDVLRKDPKSVEGHSICLHQLSALVAYLPTSRPSLQAAVIVGNPVERISLSPEWKRITEYLIDQFVEAYQRATEHELDKARSRIRVQYAEIYDQIVRSLGRDVMNVMDALRIAARNIRDLGYRRVLFCLIDPTEQVIRGVIDDSDDKKVDLARMTRFDLNEPLKNIHPYVVKTKRTKIVPCADSEPLANKDAVHKAGLSAFAVVPLSTPGDVVVGTLHVERQDRDVPTPDEIEDLEEFGRRLAIALEQSERVCLLQTALDRLSEPVFVYDRCNRIRYANSSASTYLNVESGWHGRDESQGQATVVESRRDSSQLLDAQTLMADSWLIDGRSLKHLNHSDKLRSPVRVLETMTDKISLRLELEDNTIGAVCHIRDLSYLYRVFEALELLQQSASSDKLIGNILEAMKTLGHKWGRLYLVSTNDISSFESRMCFGMKDREIERRFNAGEFRLEPSDEPGHEAWICVKERMPKVFVCTSSADSRPPSRSIRGLEAIPVSDPTCPPGLAKRPGEYWIDFPILSAGAVLGKVSLDCDPNSFGPEDLEFLKRLVELVSGLLSSVDQQTRAQRQRQEAIQAASERAVFDTCHSISTVLAAYPILLHRYRTAGDSIASVRALNHEFETLQQQISEIIDRVKRGLAPVDLLVDPKDIVELVRSALSAALPEGHWDLSASYPRITADVDDHLIRNVILELVQNSRNCCPDEDALRVKVAVHPEVLPGGVFVVIDFQDNGPGVPRDKKERIFESFFSERKGGVRGTGLGLGLVRRIINSHGGAISEAGEPGQGARFRIEIPRWRRSNRIPPTAG